MDQHNVQEQQPFDVAWRTIDGLNIRYASSGSGSNSIVLLSPWPESIFAFASVWDGLVKQFNVLAIESIVTQWVHGGFQHVGGW